MSTNDLLRRSFLKAGAAGIGGLALAQLLGRSARAEDGSRNAPWRGVIAQPQAPVRAKRVIHLCMAGGPSQFETFDWKPELKKLHGQPYPESLTQGQQLAQLQNAKLLAFGPVADFRKHGQSGQEISDFLPQIAGIADEICIIRSLYTEQINHDPAQAFMNSGSNLKGRPSMGSWLLYGLGSEAEDLPGFIVLTSQTKGGGAQPVSARQWSAGFLPSRFQGVLFQSRGDAVHYVGNPEGVCQSMQRLVVEEVNRLNGLTEQVHPDPELATRISQYEMAFRMQASVPELTDFSGEPQYILDAYGVKQPGDGSFASNCLLARRLAERGVRFIQLYHRGWDHHGDIVNNMKIVADETDLACAALVRDLKQRGMLDDTLVLWGGEFGRTPMGQGSGRDHHINSMVAWMAGGGVKPGITYGTTDELGYRPAEHPVSFHDLHATMLYLCGIQHARFSEKFQGLDARLTGVEPCRVLKEILA